MATAATVMRHGLRQARVGPRRSHERPRGSTSHATMFVSAPPMPKYHYPYWAPQRRLRAVLRCGMCSGTEDLVVLLEGSDAMCELCYDLVMICGFEVASHGQQKLTVVGSCRKTRSALTASNSCSFMSCW